MHNTQQSIYPYMISITPHVAMLQMNQGFKYRKQAIYTKTVTDSTMKPPLSETSHRIGKNLKIWTWPAHTRTCDTRGGPPILAHESNTICSIKITNITTAMSHMLSKSYMLSHSTNMTTKGSQSKHTHQHFFVCVPKKCLSSWKTQNEQSCNNRLESWHAINAIEIVLQNRTN